MDIFIATKNIHKIEEFKRLFADIGINIIAESDLNKNLIEPEENGTTFEENSLLKALDYFKQTGLTCIADDSGLCVEALGGEPGVYSARYASDLCKENVTDRQNTDKLLANLQGVADRRAYYVCSLTCIFAVDDIIQVTEKCYGEIDTKLTGENGFGYDPIFLYNGCSFASISSEEKDKISHRGLALRSLKEKIKQRGKKC